MKWNNRLTNYNFWISIVSAVLLILQAFKLEFDVAYANEIITAVLGLLVVIGIINDPTKSSSKTTSTTTKNEISSTSKVSNTSSKVEENASAKSETPINSEDENNNNFVQNDFKVLIDKISTDLETCIAQMEEMKKSNTNATLPPEANANYNENILLDNSEMLNETVEETDFAGIATVEETECEGGVIFEESVCNVEFEEMSDYNNALASSQTNLEEANFETNIEDCNNMDSYNQTSDAKLNNNSIEPICYNIVN